MKILDNRISFASLLFPSKRVFCLFLLSFLACFSIFSPSLYISPTYTVSETISFSYTSSYFWYIDFYRVFQADSTCSISEKYLSNNGVVNDDGSSITKTQIQKGLSCSYTLDSGFITLYFRTPYKGSAKPILFEQFNVALEESEKNNGNYSQYKILSTTEPTIVRTPLSRLAFSLPASLALFLILCYLCGDTKRYYSFLKIC